MLKISLNGQRVKSCHFGTGIRFLHLTQKSFIMLANLKKEYEEAQSLLLEELGLTNWEPEDQLTFTRNYSDIIDADRLDAEYHQPRYKEVIKAIQNYPEGYDTLENLVTMKKGDEPGRDAYVFEGIPFIRVSNISPFDITRGKCIPEELYKMFEQYQPEKGEILLTKDATPGIAYYLNETPEKMITSGGILRLKTKTEKVNNEYLTLVLNSLVTQEQMKRDLGGSVITHWRPSQVEQTLIPILPEDKQKKIQQKVIESFDPDKKSKRLAEEYTSRTLDIAKERGKEEALNWLKNELNRE